MEELERTVGSLPEWAVGIAAVAHDGQVDKQGQPYLYHVLRVGMKGTTVEEQVVGFLHDVIEDCEKQGVVLAMVTGLGQAPNGEAMMLALSALTHIKGAETYAQYIARLAKNPLARKVKLNDLDDHLVRLPGLMDGKARISLWKRYTAARDVIMNAEFGGGAAADARK